MAFSPFIYHVDFKVVQRNIVGDRVVGANGRTVRVFFTWKKVFDLDTVNLEVRYGVWEIPRGQASSELPCGGHDTLCDEGMAHINTCPMQETASSARGA